MTPRVSDEQLWSWADRDAVELEAYLAEHPSARPRVEELRRTIGSLAAEAEPPLPERIGPYRVLRLLGAGGMGVVYEAEQPSPRRLVAVKVVRGGLLDPSSVRRFRREIEALGRLAHPGIAAIHEAGATPDGQPFLVMERVDGTPLAAWVRDVRPARGERLRLVEAICDAVHHAHQRGVIHRDLKPSNVLVDAEGRPKILDFGLAQLADPERASLATMGSHPVLGTVPYLSPEQASGRAGAADRRSDVYAIGTILYELLVDRPPFDAEGGVAAALRAVCESTPRRPSEIDRTLRGPLETIIITALEKDPARRYATAEALANDLRRFREGKPIVARPPSPLRRLGATLGSRRFAVGIAIVAVGASGALVAALQRPRGIVISPETLLEAVDVNTFRHASPFSEVRWRERVPEVLVDGTWWELASIDGVPAADVVAHCVRHQSQVWAKRFSEDLVAMMAQMGHGLGRFVSLELRDLATGAVQRRDAVPVTEANRRTTWEANQRAGR